MVRCRRHHRHRHRRRSQFHPAPDVRDTYRHLPSSTRITAGWSIPPLWKMPQITMEAVKEFCSVQTRALTWKPPRAQAAESIPAVRRPPHSRRRAQWLGEWDSFLFRQRQVLAFSRHEQAGAKVLCVSGQDWARIYGAHCRCVSGLGEALFPCCNPTVAMEDFCS